MTKGKFVTKAKLVLAGSVAAFCWTTAAQAQMLGDSTGEIVVTARKAEESLQDVPVSVTAFGSEAINELGIEDATAIVSQVPGLNVGTPVGEGNNPSFILRGVGLNDFNDNNEGPIAVYVDDVYQAALPGLTFQLFDTKRVEVLRGPQGTLYGRNATGGLIHFISNEPTDYLDAQASLSYSEYDTYEAEAAIGGPIGDGVRVRASGKYRNSDGYVYNRFLDEDTNKSDVFAGRLQAELDLSPDTLLKLKGFYSKSDTTAPQYQHLASLGDTGASNLPFCPADVPRDIYCYADTDDDNFEGEYNRQGVLSISTRGVHASVEHDFGALTVSNIFGFQNTRKRHEEDSDVGPFDGLAATFTSDIDALSNELRFFGETAGGITYQFGGYYLDTVVRSANNVNINWRGDFANLLDSDPAVFDGLLTAFNGPIPNTADLVPAIGYDVDYRQDTEAFAAFAQGEVPITDTLTLSAGIRWTKEDRSFDYINQAPAGPLLNNVLLGLGETNFFSFQPGAVNGFANALGIGPADVVGADADERSESNVVGRLVLNYEPNPDLLLYAGWNRGFKAGGFNAGFIDQTDLVTSDQVEFDSETLDAYEAGVKWTAPGGIARINASAFYYDYKDFQALQIQGLSQVITNADATFYGGEIELGVKPLDGLTGQFAVSLLNTDVDGIVVDGVTLNNREAVIAPEFTANGYVRYGHDVGAGELYGTVSFNHQGSHYFDITNSDVSREGAYTIFNGRIGYKMDNGLELAVFGQNLFDKEYRVYTFDFTGPAGLVQQFYGKPQWFGVEVSFDM